MKLKTFYFSSFLLGCSLLLIQCGKSSNNSVVIGDINVPKVKPKVMNGMPGILSSGGASLLAETPKNPGESLKQRLFSKGPTDIPSILEEVDNAMASTQKRVNDRPSSPDSEPGVATSYYPCLGSLENDEFKYRDPVAFPIEFDFNANGNKFKTGLTTYLHCFDDLSRGDDSGGPTEADEDLTTRYWRGFGFSGTGDSEHWYIVEGSNPSNGENFSQGASAIKVSTEKDEVEMWFRVGRPGANGGDGSGVLAHLKRNPSGTIEYTHTGKGVGYGCGLHALISKKDNRAYFRVKTDQETNGEGGVECADYVAAQGNASGVDKEYCVDMSTAEFKVENNLQKCTAAGLNKSKFTIDDLDYTVVGYKKAANSFLDSPPEGTKLFYSEKIIQEESEEGDTQN